MGDKEYDYRKTNGAFMGSHFEYDEQDLKNNPILAAHFIHSIVRMRYNEGRIAYFKKITVDEMYIDNKDFFDAVVERYKRERNYEIELKSIKSGIKWFLMGIKAD